VWSAIERLAIERLVKETVRERRGSKRFRLHLPVVFSWRDSAGTVQSGEGSTGNISGRGIYVRTKVAPPLGTTVEMNVFLPQSAYCLRAGEIHAKGQVTRIDHEPQGQLCGFAAINRTVLIRESIEQALDKKNGAEQGSRVA